MHAAFLPPRELGDWSDAVSLTASLTSTNQVAVVAHVGISVATGYKVRVDILQSTGHSCFQDVRCLNNIVYIGYGKLLFVAHPFQGGIQAYSLDGYFGHLYTTEELGQSSERCAVFATSASEVLSFSPDGSLQWRTGELAVDGVVLSSIQDEIVIGSGEWDPSGGWEPFTICAKTGQRNAA